jgi:hypothetical protein
MTNNTEHDPSTNGSGASREGDAADIFPTWRRYG